MTQSVVDPVGRLTVSLYHGTSTLFYESIVSFGLGGRNIVRDLGIRAAAKLLLELSDAHDGDEKWFANRSACSDIAIDHDEQPTSDIQRSFSCRYGTTYVSASRETAANYALPMGHGGEALCYTLRLYQQLSAIRNDLTTRKEFEILRFFAAQHSKPLVVEATDVNISSLKAYQGEGMERLLARLANALNDAPGIYDSIVGQENFELTWPIPSAQLSFQLVQTVTEFDGDGGSRENLVFTPYKA